jgi:hypothetical protein
MLNYRWQLEPRHRSEAREPVQMPKALSGTEFNSSKERQIMNWIPIELTAGPIHGYYRVRYPDGLRIEVVRCYPGEWSIFTYRRRDNDR